MSRVSRAALWLVRTLALTAAAPAAHPVGRGWVLAGFATAAAVAGLPLYLAGRRRRTAAAAERVRDRAP